MSWDVEIQKMPENIDLHDVPEDFTPEPLCSREYYEKMISDLFPNIDSTDKSWMILEGDGYSIEFNSDNDDPLKSIMLHVRGDKGAIDEIIKIHKYTGWKMIDASSNEYIDFQNNPDKGFSEWRNYSNHSCASENIQEEIDKTDWKWFLVSLENDDSIHSIKKGFNIEALIKGPFFLLFEVDKTAGIAFGILYCFIFKTIVPFINHIPNIIACLVVFGIINALIAYSAYNLKDIALKITGKKHVKVFAPGEDEAMMIGRDHLLTL